MSLPNDAISHRHKDIEHITHINMHYPEIENQILADEVSLPKDAISHGQHTHIITQMVSADLLKLLVCLLVIPTCCETTRQD